MDYDLKVGYACNNKCFHCVVESFRYNEKKEEREEFNYKYTDILNILDGLTEQIDNFVVTGGEPTLRKDFMRILRQIRGKARTVSLQTNGRLLYKYLEDINKENLVDYFVIAMHGFEETHNDVTGCRGGNPFQETLNTLYKMKEVYGDRLNDVMRLEIVLSRKNLSEFVDFTEFMLSEGFLNVGISYPHLDGFAHSISLDYAKQIGFPYTDLSPHIHRLFKLLDKYPKSEIMLEMVPYCVLKDENGNHYSKLPTNYFDMSRHDNPITVNFPDRGLSRDFANEIQKDFRKFDICKLCKYCNVCVGVWEEYEEMFGSEGLSTVEQTQH